MIAEVCFEIGCEVGQVFRSTPDTLDEVVKGGKGQPEFLLSDCAEDGADVGVVDFAEVAEQVVDEELGGLVEVSVCIEVEQPPGIDRRGLRVVEVEFLRVHRVFDYKIDPNNLEFTSGLNDGERAV